MTAEPKTHRVAIVTGGGRGLGRAMVRGLAGVGLRVVATAAREEAEIRSAASEFPADQVIGVRADVRRAEDCARVIQTARERFGRIDVLVNNAGRGMKFVGERFLSEPAKFWRIPEETWRLVIDTNVTGPFLMAREAAPAMIEAGWGRIVNLSMNRETMAREGFSPYGPSKAALESETAIWAKDLAGTGVTVNAMLPGGIALTGMIPDGVSEAMRGRMHDPSIMVPALLWLVSGAADGVTGKRLIANRWRGELPGPDAIEEAGWPG